MPINRARLRSCAAASLLALSLASPIAAAPAARIDKTSAVAVAPAVRIDNFGRVDSTFYRGAQPEGRDYADLKALGVKTIINLTSDDADPNEKAMTESAGMAYVGIPMTTHTAPTPAQLADFLRIVNDPASQPVYVHCVGGRHRTGVMTATYRLAHDGWTADQAYKEMKQYNFGSDFLHPEFKDFVYRYRAADVHSVATAAVGDR